MTSGIIDRQSQVKCCAFAGERLGVGDGFAQWGRQAVPPPDDAYANALVQAVRCLCQQVLAQDFQDGLDLRGRPLSVSGGEGEQRERVNSQVRRATNHASRGLRSRTMSGRAW